MKNKVIYSSIRFNERDTHPLLSDGIIIKYKKMIDISYIHNYEIGRLLASNYDAYVFTSQHAVKHIIDLEQKELFSSKNKISISTYGKTSELLNQTYFINNGQYKDSLSIAESIKSYKYTKIAHITSKWRLPLLEESLKTQNIQYVPIEVYEKKILPCELDEYHALIFSSPSNIDAYLKSNQKFKDVPCFCIGTTTSAYLKSKGVQNVISSDFSSKNSILKTVKSYFNIT